MFDPSIQHLFEFDKPHFVRDRPPKGTPAGNFTSGGLPSGGK